MANLDARLRRLERHNSGKDLFPLVCAQGPDESSEEAVLRHLQEHPGLSEYLARHDKFLLVLDRDGEA